MSSEVKPVSNPLPASNKQQAPVSTWKPLSESEGYIPINTSCRLTYIIARQTDEKKTFQSHLKIEEDITKQLTDYFKRREIVAQNVALESSIPKTNKKGSCSGFRVGCTIYDEKKEKKSTTAMPAVRLIVDFFHFEFLQLKAAVNFVSTLLLDQHNEDPKDLTVGILALRDVIDEDIVARFYFPCIPPVTLVEHCSPVHGKCVKKRIINEGAKDGPLPRRLVNTGINGAFVYEAHVLPLKKNNKGKPLFPNNWADDSNLLEITPIQLGGHSTRFVYPSHNGKPSSRNDVGRSWLRDRNKVLGLSEDLMFHGMPSYQRVTSYSFPEDDDPRYETIRPDRILFSYPTSKIMKIDAKTFGYMSVCSKLVSGVKIGDNADHLQTDDEKCMETLWEKEEKRKKKEKKKKKKEKEKEKEKEERKKKETDGVVRYEAQLFLKHDEWKKELNDEFNQNLVGCPEVAKEHAQDLFNIESGILRGEYQEGKLPDKVPQIYDKFRKELDSNAARTDEEIFEKIKEYANKLYYAVEDSSRGLYPGRHFANKESNDPSNDPYAFDDAGVPKQLNMDRGVIGDDLASYQVSEWIAEGILSMRYGEEAVLKYEDGNSEVQYVAVKLNAALTDKHAALDDKCDKHVCCCVLYDGLRAREGNKVKDVLYIKSGCCYCCCCCKKIIAIESCIGCIKCLGIVAAGLTGACGYFFFEIMPCK